MDKKSVGWVVALSVVGFIFSWLVYFQHQGSATLNGVCRAIGSFGQCDIVGSSAYSHLFGFDNSILGILGFGVMIFMSAHIYFYKPSALYRKLILLGSILSGVLAIAFVYLQAFVIGAYCIYCLVVDAAAIVMLAIALHTLRKLIWE